MFSNLALSVKQCFQQQLKIFTPKTEADIINVRQEAAQIYESLSTFQPDYLGLKSTVKAYLKEVAQYAKLKAQLEG